MTKKVVVLGGGVAGLSAAQELAERGFEVDVYERLDVFGGKARSIDVPGSATGNRKPLPGEHGFRFFPSFYQHTFDTMRRIPFGNNDQGVYDNLVPTEHVMAARAGASEIILPTNLPDDLADLEALYRIFIKNQAEIPRDEMRFFVGRILTFLTSCEERRVEEYDYLPWWDFIEADRMSEEYKAFLAVGLSRDLVAMKAEVSSTRTVAKIYVQLLLGMAAPWLDVNRILNGPTTEVWIDPWVSYLTQLGVNFHRNATVESIGFDGDQITGVDIDLDGTDWVARGDYYLFALPVEVMAELVDEDIADAAASLDSLDELQTGWMSGLQYFLNEDITVNHGHIIYVDSPWALTSIFEHQFWDDIELSEYGDGDIKGFLSICISDWDTVGETVAKPARECTPDEIEREVWHQLTERLNDTQQARLDRATIVEWFLSPTIEFPPGTEAVNTEPLLLNTVGALSKRPEASMTIPNMFLASDYVRTHTDLATMESANEAARRAVNAILSQQPDPFEPCMVTPLREPAIFEPLKAYDRLRFEMGLPHRSLT
ncbi:MAG: FAD-dependent oxidoreductase [Persicimonas sp.]